MSFYSAVETIKTTFRNNIEQIFVHPSINSLQRLQRRLMLPTIGFLHHQSAMLGFTTDGPDQRDVE